MDTVTGTGTTDRAAPPPDPETDGLAAALRGDLVTPADPGYDLARQIWNGSVDRRPAAIAYCAGVADVIAAVRHAAATGVPFAVRSGGHSFPGQSLCDGGLVADLSRLKGIRIDPEARTARVQAGVLLGELDHETQQFGQAVPAGIVTHTGLAGLTLGGGIGWLMRRHGLTIDQLLSVDLVTAEGGYVRASENENPDLFWGVRGGGGNFGIVTEFEFRLNPVGPAVLAARSSGTPRTPPGCCASTASGSPTCPTGSPPRSCTARPCRCPRSPPSGTA
ncbi:FAD-binding oxidoreductase [Kitasatospora arboriphila]